MKQISNALSVCVCGGGYLVLTNEAESYFFPALSNIKYVFRRPNSSKYLTLMKIIRELGLPILNLFFGNWYKELNNYNKIIIFDLGYQPHMEKYLLKENPQLEIYYFNWNNIDNPRKIMKVNSFYDRSRVYTMDFNDSKNYDLKYCDTFYSLKWADEILEHRCQIENKALWLGQNKGRAKELKLLAKALLTCGVKADIRIVDESNGEFPVSDRMDYYTYCVELMKSKLIIDITQVGQSGLTLRVMESLFFDKKLITNNEWCKKMDFYNSNNILVIDPNKINLQVLRDFLNSDYIKVPLEIKEKYDFYNWVENF